MFDFSLSFTIGSLVKTTDWTIVNTTLAPGLHCGTLDCSTLSWTYSLQFDASNDTLFGTATAPFVANDSRLLTFTYEDGNISSNPFENADLTIPSKNRSGTFSFSVAGAIAILGTTSGLLLVGASAVIGRPSQKDNSDAQSRSAQHKAPLPSTRHTAVQDSPKELKAWCPRFASVLTLTWGSNTDAAQSPTRWVGATRRQCEGTTSND